MKQRLNPVTLAALMLVGIVAISFSSIFVRWSDAPVSVLGMYRLWLTDLLMLPFMWRYRRELLAIRLNDAALLALSGLFLALHFLFWMGSLRYTSVASSTVLMSLEPMFVLVGSFWLHRETVSRTAAAGMMLALVGALSMGWSDLGFATQGALLGDALSLLGTAAVAVHMLLGKQLRGTHSSFVYSFVVFAVAGAAFCLYNMTMGYRMTGYPARDWGIFALLAVVPTVFGHLLFNWMLRYVRAATVSMTVLGEPIGASLLAYLMLGEPLSVRQAFAAVFILTGVWLFVREEGKISAPPS